MKTLCISTTISARYRVSASLEKVTGLRSVRFASSRAASFQIFRDVGPLRALRREQMLKGRRVGFVPTMGALHDGHLSLVEHALQENDDVFVSIYVNPTQFGVHEDLDKYPKTWESDLAKLETLEKMISKSVQGRICGIFAPTTKVMYPTLPPSSDIDGDGSFVTITPMGHWLEGASRPVFFRGVATVCTKLFNIVQPDVVYFGQKDAQQSVLIQRMVQDFHIPVTVQVVETSREEDGLAMSSRNVYLGARRRKDVSVFPASLKRAQALYHQQQDRLSVLDLKRAVYDEFKARFELVSGAYIGDSCKLEVDYVAVSSAEDMEELADDAVVQPASSAILSAALRVYPVDRPETEAEKGQIMVRLIDNVVLKPK